MSPRSQRNEKTMYRQFQNNQIHNINIKNLYEVLEPEWTRDLFFDTSLHKDLQHVLLLIEMTHSATFYYRANLLAQYWIPRKFKQCMPIKRAKNWRSKDEDLEMVIKEMITQPSPLANQILGKRGVPPTSPPNLLLKSRLLIFPH